MFVGVQTFTLYMLTVNDRKMVRVSLNTGYNYISGTNDRGGMQGVQRFRKTSPDKAKSTCELL